MSGKANDPGKGVSVRVLSGAEAENEGLIEEILRLDRENMMGILGSVDLDFPEEKRCKGLGAHDKVIIAAFRSENLIGYLDYGPSWDDPEDVFIGSLQVAPPPRGGVVLGRLIAHAVVDLENREFRRIVTGAQRTNTSAITLYRRLGFSQHPRSNESFMFAAGRGLLSSPEVLRLKLRYSSSAHVQGDEASPDP